MSKDDRKEVDQNDPRITWHRPTAEKIFDRLAAMVEDAEESVERARASGNMHVFASASAALTKTRHAFAVAAGTALGGTQFNHELENAKARIGGAS